MVALNKNTAKTELVKYSLLNLRIFTYNRNYYIY